MQPTNEFNIASLFSESGRRNLLNLALSGNDAVLTPFVSLDGLSPNARAEAQRRRNEDFQTFARVVLASQERLQTFAVKLNRLDAATTAALIENEEKLRVAREELRRIREHAYELIRPDGTVTKAYRDGSVVRDDDGALVPDVQGQDIPDRFPTWAERKSAGQHVEALVESRIEILEFQEKLKRAERKLSSGGISEQELSDLEKELDNKMPASARREYDRLGQKEALEEAPITLQSADASPTFETRARPTAPFADAAIGNAPKEKPDRTATPLNPAVSTPSPM